MNKYQTDYAVRRVDEIAEEKRRKAGQGISEFKLDLKRKAALIDAGEVKLRSGAKNSAWIDWPDAFDFSKFDESKQQEKKRDAAVARINARASAIKDQLMLGDAEAALTLIEAFAAESAA